MGQLDREWGELVVAFVVTAGLATDAIDPQVLDKFCLHHLARFKRPKRYVVVPSLPKNNYGKVLKRDCGSCSPCQGIQRAALYWRHLEAENAYAHPASDILELLRRPAAVDGNSGTSNVVRYRMGEP